VYANPNDPMITTMRQDFAHKYQQRFQISQAPAPDRSYYLLDKQLSKKYKLPTPDFKGLEEDSWHNGQNSWSSEHDQWAKESVEQQYSVTTKVVDTDLQVGDPIKVTGSNEFKGKPGRLSEFSPSGRFVIVDLYNHGMHSMNLADIEYDEETAKTDPKDDYWNENAVDETIRKLGSQYRLYSGKGKNLGTFPTRAGAEKHEREVQYFKHAGEGVAEAGDRVDPILIRALERMPDGLATHDQVLNAAYDAYAMELGKMKMKSDYGVTRAYIPQLMDLYKNKYGLDIKEAQTDFFKRRERERKVNAGQPVKPLPRNPQTDYAKKRAKEKRDLEQFGETTNYWTRLQNERNTKIASLVSELTESVKDIK